MMNVLILGANGQLACNATRVFLRDTDAKLTLCLRRASRLSNPDPDRVTIALNSMDASPDSAPPSPSQASQPVAASTDPLYAEAQKLLSDAAPHSSWILKTRLG